MDTTSRNSSTQPARRAQTTRRRAGELLTTLLDRRSRRRKPAPLNLALQGGGSHGAFTWGVLDRLLEEEELTIEGISGASAGAMNAVILANGYLDGGRAGAQRALRAFWEDVSRTSRLNPLQNAPFTTALASWMRAWSPGYALLRTLARNTSPYQLNPSGYNPLLSLLERHVDFERLRRSRQPKLFIAVTNVHTGELRVLRNHELTPAALAASACLPMLFHAIALDDGQHYWDGGYSANPPLTPLLLECRSHRLLLVRLSPLYHPEVPQSADEILARANEFTFNAGLLRELQILQQMQKQARFGVGRLARRLRALELHEIHTDGQLLAFGESSRGNADWPFLQHLHRLGWRQADQWLADAEEPAAEPAPSADAARS